MREYFIFFCYLISTYMIGGIPFGFVIGKIFKGIDIRQFGSGNIGATNSARVLGKKYGMLVLFLDGLKSFFPVYIANAFWIKERVAMVLFCAVVGHIFSIWLKGKGGKGIASMFFGLFGLNYQLAIVMLMIWLLVFRKTKISSLSSLSSVVVVSLFSFFLQSRDVAMILTAIGLIIFWAHRSNIVRLLANKEFKIVDDSGEGFDKGDG